MASHLRPSPLPRLNSWYSLTLNEVENQLGNLGKPLGSLNLDELLSNVWSTPSNQSTGTDGDASTLSASSLQRQASLSLARSLSGRTVDQVWKDIQRGQKKRFFVEMKDQEREPSLGETTLEDFLVQAGLFAAETSLELDLDSSDVGTPHSFPQQIDLLPSRSISTLTDTVTPGSKRDAQDAFEKTIDRRLRRKIKNRESAARSRARKQAYHNQLVTKVSGLEEQNLKLKKEKDFEKMVESDLVETRYQLRRTSSANF